MFGCGVQAVFTGTAYSYGEVKEALGTDVEATFSQLHQLGTQVHFHFSDPQVCYEIFAIRPPREISPFLHYLSRDRGWSFGHTDEFLLGFRSAWVAERMSLYLWSTSHTLPP